MDDEKINANINHNSFGCCYFFFVANLQDRFTGTQQGEFSKKITKHFKMVNEKQDLILINQCLILKSHGIKCVVDKEKE